MTRPLMPVLALLVALVLALAACSDDSDGGASADAPADESTAAAEMPEPDPEPAPEPEPEPEPEPPAAEAEPGLPDYTAGYRDFTGLVSLEIPENSGAPHGGVKNVFATADREGATFPDGAVVVKEGERGGDQAAIVAIMRKVAGVDPEHGDWEYIEYSRSDPASPYTILAQDQVCWGCHMGAIDNDWVFTPSP